MILYIVTYIEYQRAVTGILMLENVTNGGYGKKLGVSIRSRYEIVTSSNCSSGTKM